MMVRGWTAALALTGVLAFAPAHALDDSEIDRWLESMQELQSWGESQEDLAADEYTPEGPEDMDFERMLAQSAQQHEEVRAIIRSHGYQDVGEWSRVGGRIYRALMAVEMQGSGDMRGQMEQAMQQLEDNPNISDEQKQQFRQQMERQMEQIAGMYEDVPEEDIRAVQRRRQDLQRIME
ncbi:hypothetical protein QWY84_09595 [Aquisalimonas lutea]|uniref:hypothetical protein n=1 Tax=Aquisalimonas lutea TaxID=1327750 RepID=UPI0025B4695F|nr:hypothetical protein [Aquisalimonas lutea]MDN3517864.1 hypothetical protein [Aquisalimonas lutea]